MVAVSVEALLSAPCPRVGVTVTDLGVGDSVVSVWRTADGLRESVRGARRVAMNDASYVEDWDAPLGRPVTYEVEVISGPSGASRTYSDAVTVESDSAWLMDPLVPQSAVSIQRRMVPGGETTFAVSAMANLEFVAQAQVFKILGSDKPMALFGQRMAASGVDFSMITAAAEQTSRLRTLLQSTAQVLVRLPASWSGAVPGSCFTMIANVSEAPVDASSGGVVSVWSLTGDTVSAPTIRVLTASFTYGDVEIITTTYQQKLDSVVAAAAAAGESPTYLFDMKHPIG